MGVDWVSFLMDPLIAELLKLGLAGLWIGYLMLINKQQRDDLRAKDTIIQLLQDKRVVEAAKSVATMGEIAVANEKISEALGGLSRSVQDNSVKMAEVAANVQNIAARRQR